jgi:hypothetical protein
MFCCATLRDVIFTELYLVSVISITCTLTALSFLKICKLWSIVKAEFPRFFNFHLNLRGSSFRDTIVNVLCSLFHWLCMLGLRHLKSSSTWYLLHLKAILLQTYTIVRIFHKGICFHTMHHAISLSVCHYVTPSLYNANTNLLFWARLPRPVNHIVSS